MRYKEAEPEVAMVIQEVTEAIEGPEEKKEEKEEKKPEKECYKECLADILHRRITLIRSSLDVIESTLNEMCDLHEKDD